MLQQEEDRTVDSDVASAEFEEGELKVEEGELMVVDPMDFNNEEIHEDFIVQELLKTKFDKDRFPRGTQIQRHMQKQSVEMPYHSQKCKAELSSNKGLKRHIIIHTEKKPSECAECEEKFSKNSDFKRHMQTHDAGWKPYKCKKCRAGFLWIAGLNNHMRTHTGEKPYKFQICEVGF